MPDLARSTTKMQDKNAQRILSVSAALARLKIEQHLACWRLHQKGLKNGLGLSIDHLWVVI